MSDDIERMVANGSKKIMHDIEKTAEEATGNTGNNTSEETAKNIERITEQSIKSGLKIASAAVSKWGSTAAIAHEEDIDV